MVWDWIVPFLRPRMAATNSGQAHQHPLGPVFFNGFNHVIGTSRPKTAGRRKGRGNKALVKSNRRYQYFLNHYYYTYIITFDYVKGKTISGDIFISLTRISENASTLSSSFEKELLRVLAHGVLHLCGYKDKSDEEQKTMRAKEDFYINLF